jgi:hypothetical protein
VFLPNILTQSSGGCFTKNVEPLDGRAAIAVSRPIPHNSRITQAAKKRASRPASSASGKLALQTDARLGRIVRLLVDHATVVVSGTKIAAEIGTGRSEVWRLVQQLRDLGVDIAGHP